MPESAALPYRTPPDTGSEAIDAEHGIQLGLLDAARASLEGGSEQADQYLEQLYSYTQAHFMSEQLLMRQSGQSNYQGHELEHEILLQQMDELCSLAKRGERQKARSLINEHEKRLLAHIQTWDRNIGQ